MNRLYCSFAILCCFALCGSVIGNPVAPKGGSEAAKGGLEVAKEGVTLLNNGFDLYSNILDKVVPWSDLNKTIANLDKFRSDYSTQAAALVGEVKTKMLSGMDAYNTAVQSVFQWCGLATNLLDTYSKLLNGKLDQKNFDEARKILLQVLDEGIKKMSAGQKALTDASSNFNEAAGKLVQLSKQLEADFNQNSEYYQNEKARIRKVAYASAAPFLFIGLAIAAGVVEGKLIPELNAKMASIERWYKQVTAEVQASSKNIDDTKIKLQDEIKRIGDVKVQTETAKTYVELDDNASLKGIVLKAVADLIAKCKEYKNKHGGGA